MLKQIVIGGVMMVFLIGSGLNTVHAGVFAGGGGESRTIAAVYPAQVYNAERQTVILTGNFSKKKGDRRVVVSGPRLLGAVPLTQIQWRTHKISATFQRNLRPGDYMISIEKFSRKDKRWHRISNEKSVEVIAGTAPMNRDGSPHNAPISVLTEGTIDSICAGPPIRRWFAGGPFQRDGRSYAIRAELRALPLGPGRLNPPRVRVLSPTRAMVFLQRCLLLYPNLEIHLIYPDGTQSNWVSIADPQVARVGRLTARLGGGAQRLRAP